MVSVRTQIHRTQCRQCALNNDKKRQRKGAGQTNLGFWCGLLINNQFLFPSIIRQKSLVWPLLFWPLLLSGGWNKPGGRFVINTQSLFMMLSPPHTDIKAIQDVLSTRLPFRDSLRKETSCRFRWCKSWAFIFHYPVPPQSTSTLDVTKRTVQTGHRPRW